MGHEVSVTSLQLARGRSGDRQRRLEGEAPPGDRPSKARPAAAAYSRRAAGADSASGDRHHHAPDDGRRGAARHRPRPREPEGLHVGRKDGIGADLRRQGARLHAQLQREFSGFRAGGESANRDRRDAEPHHRRYAGLWRTGGRAGFPRGRHGRAADAGCAQGSSGDATTGELARESRQRTRQTIYPTGRGCSLRPDNELYPPSLRRRFRGRFGFGRDVLPWTGGLF